MPVIGYATEGFGMGEAGELGFLSSLGQEFCWALSPPVPDDLIVPHDGYELWLRTLGADPTPAALASLTELQVEQLRAACAGYFECPAVSAAAVRLAVSRTLARWPAADTARETSPTPDNNES